MAPLSAALRNFPPVYLLGIAVFSFLFVSVSSATVTWLVLLFTALCFAAGALWFKDIQNVLFFGFIFTSSISISKALIVTGGIYTPGLSLTISDLFLTPLLVLWLFDKKVVKGEKIYWCKLHLFPFLFLAWLWITVFISEDRVAGFFVSLSYSKYFLVFILVADYVKTAKHIRLVLYAFGLAMCVQFMMVGLELLVGNTISLQGAKTTTTGTSLVFDQAGGVHAFRPSGFMGHPNALADLLVYLLPPLFLLLLLGRNRIGVASWYATGTLFVGGVVVLLLTLSRGGWISYFCATLFSLYVGYKRGVIARKYINLLIVLGAASMLCAVLIFPTVYLRITESDQRSSESRVAMMHQAGLIIRRNPIAGVGVGGYNRAARANIPEYFSNLSPWFQDELLKGVVHNKYLLVMSETGTIGIVLFLIMLYRFVVAVPSKTDWSDPVLFSLGLGLAAGIVGQTLFYLFDHFYTDPRITICYVYFGLLAAVIKIQNIENESKSGDLHHSGAKA